MGACVFAELFLIPVAGGLGAERPSHQSTDVHGSAERLNKSFSERVQTGLRSRIGDEGRAWADRPGGADVTIEPLPAAAIRSPAKAESRNGPLRLRLSTESNIFSVTPPLRTNSSSA